MTFYVTLRRAISERESLGHCDRYDASATRCLRRCASVRCKSTASRPGREGATRVTMTVVMTLAKNGMFALGYYR
jgi:hypothetical protein